MCYQQRSHSSFGCRRLLDPKSQKKLWRFSLWRKMVFHIPQKLSLDSTHQPALSLLITVFVQLYIINYLHTALHSECLSHVSLYTSYNVIVRALIMDKFFSSFNPLLSLTHSLDTKNTESPMFYVKRRMTVSYYLTLNHDGPHL